MSVSSPKNIFLFILLFVGVLLWQYYTNRHHVEKSEILNHPAPLVTLQDSQGRPFDLRSLIGKKVILLNFWATWCAPCRDEMPVLETVLRSSDTQKFELLSVMEDDAATPAEYSSILAQFKKKIPISFDVYTDPNGMAADIYGTYKIPESYLIDLKGNVVRHYEGGISDFDREELVEQIAELGKVPTP